MENEVNSTPAPVSSPDVGGGQGVSLFVCLIVALLCSVSSSFFLWRHLSATSAPQVLVVDSAFIMQKYLESRASTALSQEDVDRVAEDFVKGLNSAIKVYVDDGAVVVNTGVSLGYPPSSDITKDVAASLGVQLQ